MADFMGIYKRANGVYYVQLNIDGKKIQKSLKTKNHILAKDLYHVILREHLLKNWFTSANMPIQSSEQKQLKTEKVKQTPNFINWYYKYLEHCKTLNLSKRTVEQKERLLKVFKSHKIDSFNNLNNKMLGRFWDSLKLKYRDDSIRKISADLKVFLNYCIKQGIYSMDELNKLDFPKLTTKVRDKTYTDEQWNKIQNAVSHDKDFLLYLQTLYYIGCRPHEIVNLTKNDIEDNGLIKIFQNKVKKYKYVTVPPAVLNDLLSVNNNEIFRGYGKQISFYGMKFKKVRDKLGLSGEYTLYTFRHTFATNLLNKTNDIHLVSKALGHDSQDVRSAEIDRTSKFLPAI